MRSVALLAVSIFATALASCARAPSYAPPALADDRLAAPGESLAWNFDRAPYVAGSGAPTPHPNAELAEVLGHWRVEMRADAPSAPNAFCQRGAYRDADEARVYATKIAFDLVDEEVACAVDASSSCGLVAAARASDQYVVARLDARDGSLAIVVVQKGDATELARASVAIAPGAWHRLELRITDAPVLVQASIDAEPPLTAPLPWKDPLAGRVGLATSGARGACFDDWRASRPR